MQKETKPPRREGFKTPKDEQPVIESIGIPDDTAEAIPPVDGAPILSDEWPITVRLLYKPPQVTKNAPALKELTFREPTGGDINRIGNPVHVDQFGEAIINDRKMLMMMASLCGVLSP